MNNYRITRLYISNIMRINSVDITPKDDLVIVGGKNGEGKTTLLDSIEMALGGKGSVPLKPIREGKETGEIVVELGDLIIYRTFKGDKTTVKVTTREGAEFRSQQGLLDELKSNLTFDPLAFSRMEDTEQAETMKGLAGLDFSEMDERRAMHYDDRRLVNKQAKAAGIKLDALTFDDEVPKQEVSIVELTNDLERAEAHNRENQTEMDKVGMISDQLTAQVREISILEGKVEDLKGMIQNHYEAKERLAVRLESKAIAMNELVDTDTGAIKQAMRDAEGTNRKIRANAEFNRFGAEHSALITNSGELSKQIAVIDAEKAKALREAKLPIDGLGLDEDGVTFNGLPFSQCSSAEQLRISVAMGMAVNPKLKILLIREGSLLDDDSQEIVNQMAKEHGYQIWLEKVMETPEKASVFLEDGMVKNAEEAVSK